MGRNCNEKHEGIEPHECPFEKEINEDTEFRCECCEDGTQECKWDI